jgi:N-methylhydantoinase B/oxoprolinase/acetone carboxylase alpha subunit
MASLKQPLVVSILSERRSFQPYGLHGGLPGQRGLNLLRMASSATSSDDGAGGGNCDGKVVSLGGKNTVHVNKHDALTIYSPGGGGYGVPGGSPTCSAGAVGVDAVIPVMTSGSLLGYEMAQESV